MNQNRKIYISRINKAMDYIEQNICSPISLSDVAEVACFSPFHFHRIFTAITNETLNNFMQRVKIKKAASNLNNNPDTPITKVAENTGFSSLAVFSRTFKECYKMTPSEFRDGGCKSFSKICKSQSKNRKIQFDTTTYFRNAKQQIKNLSIMKSKIEVKQMPALNLIYCRHTGEFNLIGQAYEKLMKWAGPRGLMSNPDFKTVTVYHDDPNVTDIENVRQSASIVVPENVKPEGEFGSMQLKEGNFAVGRFEIDVTQFGEAWNAMCLWVADSGYQPDEGNPYELYHQDPETHPEKKFVLDICIPVKPL